MVLIRRISPDSITVPNRAFQFALARPQSTFVISPDARFLGLMIEGPQVADALHRAVRSEIASFAPPLPDQSMKLFRTMVDVYV